MFKSKVALAGILGIMALACFPLWAQDEGMEGEDLAAPEMGVQEPVEPEEAFAEEAPPPTPTPQPVRPAFRPSTSRPPLPRNTAPRSAIRPTRSSRSSRGSRTAPPPPRKAARPPKVGEAKKAANNGGDKEGQVISAEKSGGTPDEPISFDFEDQPLSVVLEQVSKLTGRNFYLDPNLSATNVTILTHDKIPASLAYEFLESVLSTNGFSLVETLDGHLIHVRNTADAVGSPKIPTTAGGRAAPKKGFDNFTTHIVQVNYADAAEISNILKTLGSKNMRIDVYVPTNTLIMTDTADGLRRVFSFLEMADVAGSEEKMEIFTLEYTRAEVVSTQIEEVLMNTGTAPKSPTAVRQPTRPTRTPTSSRSRIVPGAQASQVIGTREETLRMVPDERLNALIVLATEGMMEQVRDLVKRLDTPTPYEANNLHIYELLNADAEQVEQALQPLVGTAPRRQGGATGGKGGTSGASGSGEVQPFEQKVQITRYDQTNSLLIVASPQDYKVLEAFVARLDLPQRQVLVDAIVMDVTISDDYGVTVDAAGITGNSGFGMTSTANISELASSMALDDVIDGATEAAKAANSIVSNPSASLALSLLGLGTDGGMTAGVYDDITLDIDGQEVTVPFVPLLFQAIEKISDLEVLSEPSLVTVDNEEASIVVGQEVPFVTATSRPATSSTGEITSSSYGYGSTRVQREEVGVKLKVTPQISEGDNVLLEIEIEVSDTDADQIGTVDILGPTTNKSLIQNKVLVKDGSTAVLAGLIRDSATRSRTQAPVLGDIPVLGFLFRSRSTRREKRNMVVLVTPHIMKEHIDMNRITEDRVREYHNLNLDELFNQGFFKKVKTKRDIRKKHRPTFDRSAALTGSRNKNRYERGDIER